MHQSYIWMCSFEYCEYLLKQVIFFCFFLSRSSSFLSTTYFWCLSSFVFLGNFFFSLVSILNNWRSVKTFSFFAAWRDIFLLPDLVIFPSETNSARLKPVISPYLSFIVRFSIWLIVSSNPCHKLYYWFNWIYIRSENKLN